ncbi:MAG TPA: hypothetical protein VK211_20145 [Kamptonema sp.]|nr:hypothetical protein [Kamptonema sp.]
MSTLIFCFNDIVTNPESLHSSYGECERSRAPTKSLTFFWLYPCRLQSRSYLRLV